MPAKPSKSKALKCPVRLCGRIGQEWPDKRPSFCAKHGLEPRTKKSKYRNIRSESHLVGRTFDSGLERRLGEQKHLEQEAGLISGLKYQETFRLDVYRSSWVDSLIVLARNVVRYPREPGRIAALEMYMLRDPEMVHVTNYRSDVSWDSDDIKRNVADAKGIETDLFRAKKRLMDACHDIEVKIVRAKDVPK